MCEKYKYLNTRFRNHIAAFVKIKKRAERRINVEREKKLKTD